MNAPGEASLDRAAHQAQALALPWLVADVGGTNARFGWVEDASLKVTRVQTLPVAEHPGPAQAARAYLKSLHRDSGSSTATPRRSAWALATALDGDWVELTNGHWCFSRSALMQSLGLEDLRLLNDFEALALSLPHLEPSQLRAHGALPQAQGMLAVIGPGTGLGVAGVVQTAQGWKALPGEGGHATLAATDEQEALVLAEVRRHFEHVSAERLLSGIGLPVLYRAVCAVAGETGRELSAPQIVEAGTQGTDPLCGRTLDLLCAFLGSFAGNVALTLGARGGVYIGGGIVPRLGERFFQSSFREKFEAKGRFRSYLADIPTALITDTLAALRGAAASLDPDRD
ncbi:MAG: glucokinase [Rubrivivax sp.]